MAKVFILTGSTGAGKSTYARVLANKYNAQIMTIDEWMQNLFWQDSPTPPDFNWVMTRVKRCELQIKLVSLRLLQQKISVILDLGFSKKVQREEFQQWAKVQGFESELHYLDVPVEVRRARVKNRNEQKTETFHFEVTEATFNWMEDFYEPPSGEELAQAVHIKSDQSTAV